MVDNITVGQRLYCQYWDKQHSVWLSNIVLVEVKAVRRCHATQEVESVKVTTVTGPRHTIWVQPPYLHTDPQVSPRTVKEQNHAAHSKQ